MQQLPRTRLPVATSLPHRETCSITAWGRDDRNNGATFLDSDFLQGPQLRSRTGRAGSVREGRGLVLAPQGEHCSALKPRLMESGEGGWGGEEALLPLPPAGPKGVERALVPSQPRQPPLAGLSHTPQVCASFLRVGLGS